MPARISEPLLHIRISETEQRFVAAGRGEWTRPAPNPPAESGAEGVWKRIEADWGGRRDRARDVGAELGRHLLDGQAVAFLQAYRETWSTGRPAGRIEVSFPPRLADWPWELASAEGLGTLAVNSAFTFVRSVGREHGGAQTAMPPLPRQLAIELVGPALVAGGVFEPLQVGPEIERARVEIERPGGAGNYSVKTDLQGDWQELWERYDRSGPPHVFHFAGHGLSGGRGLVFRGPKGRPHEVPADVIASILTKRKADRRTWLAVLNACSSAQAGHGPSQPFGGLARQLTSEGVPYVIGLLAPLEDEEAIDLAANLYVALNRGDPIDCAVQDARRRLYERGSAGVSWGFFALSAAMAPGPLWQPSTQAGRTAPSATLMSFGHKEQRDAMELFLQRRRPMVVLISGPTGAGHAHVAERLKHDLENAKNVLWRPVAELEWYVVGEPTMTRTLLAACIARSLSISDTGTPAELEARLAREISERCAADRTVVIDLVRVLSLRDKAQAEALVTLVQDLWAQLMDEAAHYRSDLPVYLLLRVAYAAPVHESDPKFKKIEEQRVRTLEVIKRLKDQPQLKGAVRVVVLPELKPLTEEYVANFLENVLDLAPERAGALALDICDLNDNETILERVRDLLNRWSENERL